MFPIKCFVTVHYCLIQSQHFALFCCPDDSITWGNIMPDLHSAIENCTVTPYPGPNHSRWWHCSIGPLFLHGDTPNVGPAILHCDTPFFGPPVKHADSYHLQPSCSTRWHTPYPGPTVQDGDTLYLNPTSAGCKLRPIVNLGWLFITAHLGPWAHMHPNMLTLKWRLKHYQFPCLSRVLGYS